MLESKTLTESRASSLEKSILNFINTENPESYKFSCFYDPKSSSSCKYTAIIIYKK